MKVSFLLILITVFLSGSFLCQNLDAKISEEEVLKLFEIWNLALQTGNPEEVVKLYSEDAVLVPTVSNKVRTNHSEIHDYFEYFLRKRPKGEINEFHVNVYGDWAISSGIYTFSFTEDGQMVQAKARFSYVYRLINDKWLIVNHHSSLLPE